MKSCIWEGGLSVGSGVGDLIPAATEVSLAPTSPNFLLWAPTRSPPCRVTIAWFYGDTVKDIQHRGVTEDEVCAVLGQETSPGCFLLEEVWGAACLSGVSPWMWPLAPCWSLAAMHPAYTPWSQKVGVPLLSPQQAPRTSAHRGIQSRELGAHAPYSWSPWAAQRTMKSPAGSSCVWCLVGASGGS